MMSLWLGKGMGFCGLGRGLADGLGMGFCGWVGVLGRGFVDGLGFWGSRRGFGDEVLWLGKEFCVWVGDELLRLEFCGWVEVLMLGLIWVWDCFGIRVLKMAG